MIVGQNTHFKNIPALLFKNTPGLKLGCFGNENTPALKLVTKTPHMKYQKHPIMQTLGYF